MTILKGIAGSRYLMLAALRPYFPESAVQTAISALFPEPDEPGYSDDDFEEVADDWEPYVPSEADLAEYSSWSESLERQRLRDEEFVEMQAICDMIEAMEDERRYTDQDLERSAGLQVG